MSVREALVAARNALELVLECEDLATAKRLVARTLGGLDAIADRLTPGAQHTRAWRERQHGPPKPHGEVTVSHGEVTEIGGVGGDLFSDQGDPDQRGEESSRGESESRLITVSHGEARKTRKKQATHCPGVDETPEAIDAWCRAQGIPPASQSAQVRAMLLWHQSKGQPQASWKARLRSCAWGDRPANTSGQAAPLPYHRDPTPRTDGQRCELHGAEACKCPEWRLTRPGNDGPTSLRRTK